MRKRRRNFELDKREHRSTSLADISARAATLAAVVFVVAAGNQGVGK